MYHVAVFFDVQPEHRQDFINAAIKDGQDSGANEPGTLRFELIQDETNENRFYLNEGYESAEAFDIHANGQYFAEFFAEISSYVEGPTWLLRGNRVEA
ncbi:putative quinol monooxygenase [Plantibacter sp. Mn2098]|uniref:putative quinol monooxygenase n=1 Tax=Plantibacter sp. Mn2098 TaxID=3395266 RepID=UPI003BD740E1